MKRLCARSVLIIRVIWRSLILLPQLLYGVWKIASLPCPLVSVFGGKRTPRTSKYARQAWDLGHALAELNISIVTGGGSGIMEASSCGAISCHTCKNVRVLGVSVAGVNVLEPPNAYLTDLIKTDYFSLRRHFLIYYSHAFVIFPGGFGTIDDISEALTLMQTKKIPQAPVIFIGKEYWAHFKEWVDRAVAEGTIPPEHAKFMTLTDDVAEAVQIINEYCCSPRCREDRGGRFLDVG
jgi:uncharacterized protein (TIGR00730 family)